MEVDHESESERGGVGRRGRDSRRGNIPQLRHDDRLPKARRQQKEKKRDTSISGTPQAQGKMVKGTGKEVSGKLGGFRRGPLGDAKGWRCQGQNVGCVPR